MVTGYGATAITLQWQSHCGISGSLLISAEQRQVAVDFWTKVIGLSHRSVNRQL